MLLILMALAGEFGIWLVLFALFGILSALYSLVSGRRSWLGLPRRKAAGVAVGASFGVLVLGVVVAAAAMPALQEASLSASDSTTTTAPASPTPSPSSETVLLTACDTAEDSVTESGAELVCTPDEDGMLVWMTADKSKVLLADRAAATAKAEADKVASKKALNNKVIAAQKAAAQVAAAQVAAAKAAADKAIANQATADQAAAAEAARVAVEQAVQQQAPVQQAPVAPVAEVPDASAYYPNCAAARAAGAAPMHAGQSGYRPGLDRDKDGIACDK
ncbi:excalibur calcium-binding domain-containing protein [Arthrobacter livingstonensis]|nr:excalibur calcium-binding domain-containing protein [Arthrobacter livingstonensis]